MDPRTLQAAARVVAWRRAHGLPMVVADVWANSEADAENGPGADADDSGEARADVLPPEEH